MATKPAGVRPEAPEEEPCERDREDPRSFSFFTFFSVFLSFFSCFLAFFSSFFAFFLVPSPFSIEGGKIEAKGVSHTVLGGS